MPPIGETLREARMRQRIDIADVEQATKIRAKYLRALEAEEFDRLPGSTFVRTFLRSYAEYLGLDSKLLVEEYRSRHEEPAVDELPPFAPQPSPQPLAREGRRRDRPSGGGVGRGSMIAAAVVGILAILLVIGLLSGGDDEGDGRPAAASGPREERRENQDDRGGNGGRGGAEDEEVRLTIAPAADTYVCVENGEGEQLVNATLVEPETFRGQTLRVNLGNTLAVEMTVDGEEVPVEESPNPVGLEFTPEGQEEIPEGERPCQ